MIRERHRKRAGLYLLGDVLATTAAFFAAWYLRFETGWIPITRGTPELDRYLQLLPIVLVIWPIVFHFHGLYQVRRGRSRIDEILTLLPAVLLGALLLFAFTGLYRPPEPELANRFFSYSRGFLAVFTVVDLVFVGAARMRIRHHLQQRRLRGENLQRLLVVGAGKLGREIAGKLTAHRELGFQVVGFLDDDPGKAERTFGGVPVLGGIEDVAEAVEEHDIHQVYIALPLEAHKKMLRALEQVGSECVEVKIVPDILQYATIKASLEDLDGTPVINLSQVPLQGWSSLAKRAMDITLASAALVGLGPFLPLLALAIWLEDRGPILYKQERMGLDGKPFMIYKFRSMRVDAESSTGPVWATRGDSRRTRIGQFIREWSIDELPQLWNVVKGDMSLVGPRPERPTFVREFKHRLPQYMLRHRVKAGITGWAQVHGWRGNTSIRKRLQYDLYYIENWSLGLDLKILWMTVRGIRHNAY